MQKRYWLRGLIIGFCTAGFLGVSYINFPGNVALFFSGIYIWNVPGIDLKYYLVPGNTFYPDVIFRLEILISVIFWSIAGLVFGWLYGKIKNRSVHNS